MVANDIFTRVKNLRTSERSERVSEFLTSAKSFATTFHDEIYLSYVYAPVTLRPSYYGISIHSTKLTHGFQSASDVRSFDVVFTKAVYWFVGILTMFPTSRKGLSRQNK